MILDEGNGYYSAAYNIYALVLLISSYSIPTAISKLISEKIALKEYKNLKRILKCVFIYVCAIAGVQQFYYLSWHHSLWMLMLFLH